MPSSLYLPSSITRSRMTKAAEDDKEEIYLSSCEIRAYLIARETVSVVLLCFPVLRSSAHYKCLMFVPSSLGIAINGNPSNEAFRRECSHLAAFIFFPNRWKSNRPIGAKIAELWLLNVTCAFISLRGLARPVCFCERGLISSKRKIIRLFALSRWQHCRFWNLTQSGCAFVSLDQTLHLW